MKTEKTSKDTVSLSRVFRYLTPRTINLMIHELTAALEQVWSYPEYEPGDDVIAMRDALCLYMQRAWPTVYDPPPGIADIDFEEV